MHVMTFLNYVDDADRNHQLMIRVVLNTMVDALRFPVEISELRVLSPSNRAMTSAFQEWAYSHPFFEFDEMTLKALKSWVVRA